jgi:hypothetical protein
MSPHQHPPPRSLITLLLLLKNICSAEDDTGRQAIITSGGHDVLLDMLMLGTGHGEEEGAVDHAVTLLALLMRDVNVAHMFTLQVSSSTASINKPQLCSNCCRDDLQVRLAPLTALLLPSAASEDTRSAVLLVLHEQCETIAAAQQTASVEATAQYPLLSISNLAISSIQAPFPFRLFAPAARLLLCCSRMHLHTESQALGLRLADPTRSFSTSTAIHFLRRFSSNQYQNVTNVSHHWHSATGTGRCPHTEEDLIATHNTKHLQAAVVDVVGLLLHRMNLGGNISGSMFSTEIFGHSLMLLDLIPLLPPTAIPDIMTLLSTACVAVANDPSNWHNRSSDFGNVASKSVLRMMDLLAAVPAPQQLQILTCARSVMVSSAHVRAEYRSRGATATEAAVEIMMGHSSSGVAAASAAAAAASVLPFVCSDRIEVSVDTTAYPTLFPSSAARVESVSSCNHLSPANVSVLEGIMDFMYSCRSFYQPLLQNTTLNTIAANFPPTLLASISPAAPPLSSPFSP